MIVIDPPFGFKVSANLSALQCAVSVTSPLVDLRFLKYTAFPLEPIAFVVPFQEVVGFVSVHQTALLVSRPVAVQPKKV